MNITARITRITETEHSATLTFRLTEWETEADGSTDDEPQSTPAEPGQPGAWWAYSSAPEFSIELPRHATHHFEVGRSYVLDLREIVDAPLVELADA